MIEASARCRVCCSAGERASRGRAFHTRPHYRERASRWAGAFTITCEIILRAVLYCRGRRRRERGEERARAQLRAVHGAALTLLPVFTPISTHLLGAHDDPRLYISSRESRSIWCARARCARGAGARGRVVGACACACADAHARRLFATRSLARTTITFGCRAAPKVGGRGATTLGQSIYLLGAASTHVAAARGYMLYRIHFYRKESAKKKRGLFLALALSLVLSLSHPLSPR